MRKFRALSLIILAVAPFAGCSRPAAKLAPTKPPIVLFTRPTFDYVMDYEDFTGRTDAVLNVEVRARVTGYLSKVFFVDGTEIKEGDPLFEIDPRPYQAALESAEASVIQNEAHLKRLDSDHRRAQNLYSRGAIGREEFDKIEGDYTEAGATAGIARATRDLAKLNLWFTKVIAPISGRTSRRLVDPGNLVQADTTALTTIVSVDPMYVYFDIDERTLLRLRRLVLEGKIKSRNEAEIPVEVALSDEEGFPHKGIINFSDNKVDPSTGTLRVRAVVENPKSARNGERVFSPGLFVRVRLPIGEPRKSILIAEQALGTDQGRKFLYIVGEKNEVVYRSVKVGRLNDGKRAVEEGLLPGDKVIVSGLQRIRPGVKVEPKPAESVETKGGGKAKGKAGDKSVAADKSASEVKPTGDEKPSGDGKPAADEKKTKTAPAAGHPG